MLLFKQIMSASQHVAGFALSQPPAVSAFCRSAVSYIHMNMVCHRDLKPENFLISKKCEIKDSLILHGLTQEKLGLSCLPQNAMRIAKSSSSILERQSASTCIRSSQRLDLFNSNRLWTTNLGAEKGKLAEERGRYLACSGFARRSARCTTLRQRCSRKVRHCTHFARDRTNVRHSLEFQHVLNAGMEPYTEKVDVWSAGAGIPAVEHFSSKAGCDSAPH